MLYYLLDACAIVCALACIRQLRSWRRHGRSLPLPPGPKALPLIGNILDMQDPELWERARKWGDKYGPLIHLEALGTSFVFVNSYQSAVDLFERHGSIYSARPKITMIDLEGWDWAVPFMPYGDKLRRSRQLLHRFLQPAVMEDYDELQTQSVHKMLDRLLKNPDQFLEILRHSMGEKIISMTYGYQAQEKDDPYIVIAEKGIAASVEAEELFLVNLIPSLQCLPSWFPGTGFKKIAEEGYKASMAMYNEPYNLAKRNLNEGVAAASIVSKLHEAFTAGDAVISDEALIKTVAGVIYGAAADTTVAALNSFFLAMLLHPEVQRRVQDELDQNVGKDTLPSFDDRPNLPYLEAVIKETFRWQPVTPLAIAHMADEDNEYNGFFIPKGTIMFPNVWAMLRDTEEYPRPDEFIPERWLPTRGERSPVDVHRIFFGFGRRICPGRHFADSTVFIGAASILAAFNITKALDENDAPITPKAEYTMRFIRHPKPFKYVLTPRSERMANVIHQAVESAK